MKFNLTIDLDSDPSKEALDPTDVVGALRNVADHLGTFTPMPWTNPHACSGKIFIECDDPTLDGRKRCIGTWSVDPETDNSDNSDNSTIRRRMATANDRRRIADGDRALALPDPQSRDEIRAQLPIIHDAMAALQSLDDLGDEGNARAHENLRKLEIRSADLKDRLANQAGRSFRLPRKTPP